MAIPAIPNNKKIVPLETFSTAGDNTFTNATGWFLLNCRDANASNAQFADTVRIIGELNPKADNPIEADNRPLPMLWHFLGELFGQATVELNFPECPKSIPTEPALPIEPQGEPIAQIIVEKFDCQASILDDTFYAAAPVPVQTEPNPIAAAAVALPSPPAAPTAPTLKVNKPVKTTALASVPSGSTRENNPIPVPRPLPLAEPATIPAPVSEPVPVAPTPPPASESPAPENPGEPVKKPKRRLF